MEFTHNEYCFDIRSSIQFTNNTYNITPNNEILFPLLSQFANNFEFYEFTYLKFFFRSKTSHASVQATQNLGSVHMGVKYDATLPPFTSKNEMLNYQACQTTRTDTNLLLYVSIPSRKMYCRTGGLSRFSLPNPSAVLADIRNEVVGVLNIATSEMGIDNIPIGELWADYRIRLSKIKLYQTIGGANRGARYHFLNQHAGGTMTNWLGQLNTNPTNVSKYWDQLNVRCPTIDTIEFDAIDGAFIHFRSDWQSWGNAVGSVTGGARNITFPIYDGQSQTHRFMQYTANINAFAATNPRTAVLAGASTTTTYSWITPTNTDGTNNENRILRLEFCIRCIGSRRIRLQCTPNSVNGSCNAQELNLLIVDRPNMFPQQEQQSVLNPNWFTAA